MAHKAPGTIGLMRTRRDDLDAAWWAKARRAGKHIADLRSMVSQFDPETAYELKCEPAKEPGTAALRFTVRRAVPIEILTTIGDVLHNMRSCLDSVAFELARGHLGEQMTEKQEGDVVFPIRDSPSEFDKFLARSDQQNLYGDIERKALRCVQPFAIPEEALGAGSTMAATRQEDYELDELARLSHLNNRDKHRYLPLLAWLPDQLAYLIGDVPKCQLQWAQAPRAGFADGDLAGYVTFSDGNWGHARKLVARMELCLADDLTRSGEFTQVLQRWHDYLVQWVLPRIFIVAEGNPPPIAIGL